jgi:phenylalanyl-tRNA synthetase beta chain
MPTIDVEYSELERLLSVKLDGNMEKLDEILAFVKAEVKGYNQQDGTVNVEFKDTNRPDLWSVEGLARAYKRLSGAGERVKAVLCWDSAVEVFVSRELYPIRPYICCSIIKDIHLSDPIIRGLMHLQDKLDQTYGRSRQKRLLASTTWT